MEPYQTEIIKLYGPDLTPSAHFLFSRLKVALRRWLFKSNEEVNPIVLSILHVKKNHFPKYEDFSPDYG